ncbi:unnamed protein product [Eruca vesicaria subsp. sativa]|uniref:Uncharacterized protein n=1 Tax=Eruca vesicaria subsp. sativa TaxID=29727 RepID=A0ABC8JDH0_ERUVS|nr:unnamed protein product [Eruca vesicaria subsp. sativa]
MLSSATLTRKTPLSFNSLGLFGKNTSYFNRRRTLTEAGSSGASISFRYKNGRVNWSGLSGTMFGHMRRVSSVSGGNSGDSIGIGGHFCHGTWVFSQTILYLYLSKVVTASGLSGAVLRLLLDQFVFAPVFVGVFLSAVVTLEGKPSHVIPKLKQVGLL